MSTNTSQLRIQGWTAWFLALTMAAILLFTALALPAVMGSSAGNADTPVQEPNQTSITASGYFTSYLPLVSKARPVPRVLANVSLPGASCPNAIEVNPASGYVYVANSFSANVNILDGSTVLATVNTGDKPTAIASDPDSNRTYVTNLLGGSVSAFDGATLRTNISLGAGSEPFSVIVHPTSHLAYVGSLLGIVRQIQDTQIVDQFNYGGWPLALATHPHTGLVYAADWAYGTLTVISGNQRIADIPAVGWGPRDIEIDPNTGYVYVANEQADASEPVGHLTNNLTIISGTSIVDMLYTAAATNDLAIDPKGGYIYAVNHKNNTVTVLRGTELIHTLAVGARPWAVAVDPDSRYAFVTNRDDDTVTVLRDGLVVTTLPTGDDPFDVAVSPVNGDIYIANRAMYEWIDEDDVGHHICYPTTVTILR
ncbi:MAG: lactonase family protein [Chloroflexota bacterium]